MSGQTAFAAMGCEVVVAGASAAELVAIGGLFRQYDRAFSRFRPDSELVAVNARAGGPVPLSPLFARLVRIALGAARETEGLVDPTLGAALEAAGYDRDFALLRPDPRPAQPGSPGEWRSLRLIGRTLLLPAGISLDLNGVVKAVAVDDALAILRGPGFVAAGGDLATRGGTDVSLPGGDTVRLVAGGLATSGSGRRRWLRGGRAQHHLIDPRTGAPARSPWEQVTVAGATCLAADIAAKAAFLLGADGPDWLDELRIPGRFVAPDGGTHATEAWRRAAAEAVACT